MKAKRMGQLYRWKRNNAQTSCPKVFRTVLVCEEMNRKGLFCLENGCRRNDRRSTHDIDGIFPTNRRIGGGQRFSALPYSACENCQVHPRVATIRTSSTVDHRETIAYPSIRRRLFVDFARHPPSYFPIHCHERWSSFPLLIRYSFRPSWQFSPYSRPYLFL